MGGQKIALMGLCLAFSAISFAKATGGFPDQTPQPAKAAVEPQIEASYSDAQIATMTEAAINHTKAHPQRIMASTDNLSPECVEFVNSIIKAKTSDDFYNILKTSNDNYDKIPDSAMDKKFLVARMATWLPMRGVAWRMAPMVHNVIVTQEALVLALRNLAEQVEIMAPGSHVDAQFNFLTLPKAELVGKEMRTENDFMDYLASEVYPSLKLASDRIEVLSKNPDHNHMLRYADGNKELPLFFDSRIRFGDSAFNQAYDQTDRYKLLDESTRAETLSRYHHRMAVIAGMIGYNWNGHFALRHEIAQKFAVGLDPISMITNNFLDTTAQRIFAVEGATRQTRDLILTNGKYKNLYTLRPQGGTWMKLAYWNLHKSYKYMASAYQIIQKDAGQKGLQVDPDMILSRKEQVQEGLDNMSKLVGVIEPQCDSDPRACFGKISEVSGTTELQSAATGDRHSVDLKAYYYHPPQDLKTMFPIAWAGNEDLANEVKNTKGVNSRLPDVLSVNLNGKDVAFRNYRFGRATAWNNAAYAKLFPDLSKPSDVAAHMRLLNETRGTRQITNGLTLFVR